MTTTINTVNVIMNNPKSRKTEIKSERYIDLQASGTSVRDYVIEQYHSGSVNHYYTDSENSPKTIKMINERTEKLSSIEGSATIVNYQVYIPRKCKYYTFSETIVSSNDVHELTSAKTWKKEYENMSVEAKKDIEIYSR